VGPASGNCFIKKKYDFLKKKLTEEFGSGTKGQRFFPADFD
jgi:hypothetical protein